MTAPSTHQPDAYHLAEWLSRLFDAADRPPAKQRDVLTALAVKFADWGTGRGYASIKALAAYCAVGRATVERALRWGRRACLLVRLRRGHRRGDGSVWASEWLLVSSLHITTPAVEIAFYTSGVTG